jgi:hypothetical protein
VGEEGEEPRYAAVGGDAHDQELSCTLLIEPLIKSRN